MVPRRARIRTWLLGPTAALVLAGAACSEPAPAPASGAQPPAMSSSSSSSSASASELAANEPGLYELGREPLTVTLRVPEERRQRLADLAETSEPGRLRLAVEGIEALRPGGVYEVHLETPAGETPSSTSPSFLGHIALYGKSKRPSTRTFDVTGRLRPLLRDSVRITFVPAESLSQEEEGPASGPVLRFRRIALLDRG